MLHAESGSSVRDNMSDSDPVDIMQILLLNFYVEYCFVLEARAFVFFFLNF